MRGVMLRAVIDCSFTRCEARTEIDIDAAALRLDLNAHCVDEIEPILPEGWSQTTGGWARCPDHPVKD